MDNLEKVTEGERTRIEKYLRDIVFKKQDEVKKLLTQELKTVEKKYTSSLQEEYNKLEEGITKADDVYQKLMDKKTLFFRENGVVEKQIYKNGRYCNSKELFISSHINNIPFLIKALKKKQIQNNLESIKERETKIIDSKNAIIRTLVFSSKPEILKLIVALEKL